MCSCWLVCLVQNWFKAPGHRKRAALYSGHVPETSSRGSTIAIQQRRLPTPKWVCSVLHCPTWQSATYSTSPAPNMPPPPPPLLYSLFQFIPSLPPLSFCLAHISTFSLSSSPPHSCISCQSVHFMFPSPYLYMHSPPYPAAVLRLVVVAFISPETPTSYNQNQVQKRADIYPVGLLWNHHKPSQQWRKQEGNVSASRLFGMLRLLGYILGFFWLLKSETQWWTVNKKAFIYS